jgi:hypothetical protein
VVDAFFYWSLTKVDVMKQESTWAEIWIPISDQRTSRKT